MVFLNICLKVFFPVLENIAGIVVDKNTSEVLVRIFTGYDVITFFIAVYLKFKLHVNSFLLVLYISILTIYFIAIAIIFFFASGISGANFG